MEPLLHFFRCRVNQRWLHQRNRNQAIFSPIRCEFFFWQDDPLVLLRLVPHLPTATHRHWRINTDHADAMAISIPRLWKQLPAAIHRLIQKSSCTHQMNDSVALSVLPESTTCNPIENDLPFR